jgi:L-cysteine desulfidase
MNIEEMTNNLVNVVKKNSAPALGCTEPVAVAYAGAVANKYFKGDIKTIHILVSKNIYKNGKSVIVPGTGESGLALAGGLGFVGGDSDKGFMLLKDINENNIKRAKSFLKDNKINIGIKEGTPDIYIDFIAKGEEEVVETVVQDGHTNLTKVIVNNKDVYNNPSLKEKSSEKDFLKQLNFKTMREITEQVPLKDIDFIKYGIEQNTRAAEEGLKNKYGLQIGSSLKALEQQGFIKVDMPRRARIMTAAAADMRMGGGNCEIITSGGSGNQGIGVTLPIIIVAKELNIDETKMVRAAFFGNLVNCYIKAFAGKLSGMCGCAIGAGIGATVGITWMLNGSDEQIGGACNNMFANISGIICDGAKDSCSLKLSTSAEEAVLSAFLALKGTIVNPNIGIIGDNVEETIKNIGNLSHEAFTTVDDVMINILNK